MGQIRFGDLNILLIKIIMFINRWEYSVFNSVKIEVVKFMKDERFMKLLKDLLSIQETMYKRH